MKKVRVLKEMPFAKIGLVEESDNSGYFHIGECTVIWNPKEIQKWIDTGWLEWVKEPKELCMCNHSTLPGSVIMVENPKDGILVCSKCHKELPFHIFKRDEVVEDESLEKKLEDSSHYGKTLTNSTGHFISNIVSNWGYLAQIARSHYLEVFDKSVKDIDVTVIDGLIDAIIQDIRKDLEQA